MQRLKMIACKALYREISLLTAKSENFVDVTYLRQGLHDTPSLLHKALQYEIDKIDAGDDIYTYHSQYEEKEFDAILLGYGMCSNGVAGLSSKKYQIVVPKTDDCIALFMGSYEKYMQCFKQKSGTYWYTPSWIENAHTPSKQTDEAVYQKYVADYGEENAEYLMNEACLTANYSRCGYIKWNELPFPQYEQYTKDAAAYYGWDYEEVVGSDLVLRDFIDGKWDERFLVVPIGKKIIADYDGGIMTYE
ncbi:MAG: DUF1638 domain-containing protein [Christensenellaceae bacterium]